MAAVERGGAITKLGQRADRVGADGGPAPGAAMRTPLDPRSPAAFGIGCARSALLALAMACGMAAVIPVAAGEMVHQAAGLQAAGRHALALAALDAPPTGSDEALARRGIVDGLRGVSLNALGRHDEAEAALRQSVERAVAAGDIGTALHSEVNLATTLAATGQVEAALATLDEAARRAADAGRAATVLLASTNALQIASDHGVADLATWVERGRAAEAAAPVDAVTAPMRARLATLLAGVEADAGRDAALERAAAADADPATAATVLAQQAELMRRQGDIEDALLRLDEAALLAARSGDAALAARVHRNAGQLRADLGRPAAVADYRRALATVIQLRRQGAPTVDADGAPWPLDVEAAFREFLGLLLGEADHADPATRARLLEEVRTTIEQLRSFELERFFADDCVARLRATVTAIETVAPRTAVLYVLLTPDAAYALLSVNGTLAHRRLAVDRTRLEATALDFRRNVENRASNAFVADARQLHAWLLEPWREQLEDAAADTIVFIGDGGLRNVPLAGLVDGERFVAEDFAVATVPGLSLFDPRPVGDLQLSFLLAALSEPVQGFPALPHTRAEVEAIREVFGGTVLQDEAFNANAFDRAIRRDPFSVVHIASHGVFRSSGEDSFILTHDERIDLDDLDRLLSVTRFRDTPVELLTLSACETAAGDAQAALGLAGIAVKAGARSAVASLWSINDESSAELVTTFYQELAAGGVTRAEALRRAQVAQLASARFRHPAYWAPFIVIGNWL